MTFFIPKKWDGGNNGTDAVNRYGHMEESQKKLVFTIATQVGNDTVMVQLQCGVCCRYGRFFSFFTIPLFPPWNIMYLVSCGETDNLTNIYFYSLIRFPSFSQFVGSCSMGTANLNPSGKRSAALGSMSLYECRMVTSATPAMSAISFWFLLSSEACEAM